MSCESALMRYESAMLTRGGIFRNLRGPKEIGAPCGSMRGNVKRKYFSLELKWAEDVVSGIQPLWHALCECVVTKYLGCSDPPSGSC